MALAATPNKGRRIRRFPLAAAQTFLEGAPVLLDANGAVTVAGADPAVILGFAAHDAVPTFHPDPGFQLVFVAYPDATFLMEGTANPLATHVGESFELAVDAQGRAIVDVATQVANRLRVEDIYLRPGLATGFFEVSVLAANRQFQI